MREAEYNLWRSRSFEHEVSGIFTCAGEPLPLPEKGTRSSSTARTNGYTIIGPMNAICKWPKLCPSAIIVADGRW